MKKWTLVLMALIVGATSFAPPLVSSADARVRKVVVHRGPNRTRVVVHRAWPLRRPLPVVVVRPARRAVVVAPGVFLAPVVWSPTVVAVPDRDYIVWEDSETLSKDDDWTEFTLNVEDRGERMLVEVDGRAQLNFAEVVFENGDTQVVDFNEKTHGSGVYSLLDFKDGRKVDHVRMVARAKSDEAKIVLRMVK
jgi:hypothetical protein